MERDLNLTWHSYFGSGTKLGPQTIFGTPKAKNSVIKEIQSSQKKEADQKESEANQKKDKANQEAKPSKLKYQGVL